jgi:hypothetical protein
MKITIGVTRKRISDNISLTRSDDNWTVDIPEGEYLSRLTIVNDDGILLSVPLEVTHV